MSEQETVRGRGRLGVSKKQWLDAALDALATSGVEAVRVERLADRVGVAKSGFYYHFRDRADLLDQILEYWVALDFRPLLADPEQDDLELESKLDTLVSVVEKTNLARYDFAIRQWARQDAAVKRVWRKEMKRRLEWLRRAFRKAGYEGDDLEVRVRLLVAYQVSEHELFYDLKPEERKRLRRLRLKMLLRR